MTEEQKEQRRQDKARISEELAAKVAKMPAKLKRTLRYKEEDATLGLCSNARLRAYILEVGRHPERHNVMEQAAVLRFFDLFKRYEWNQVRLNRFTWFFEHCHFNGNNGPTTYKATPVQCFIFALVWGLQMPERRRKVRINGVWQVNVEAAHRLIREIVLYVPRKFSKTSMAAAFAIYELRHGPNNAHVFMASNSGDQSALCYDEAMAIMEGWFPRLKYVRDKDKKLNKREIVYNTTDPKDPSKSRRCYVRCLNNAPKRLDGLNASLVIMDEYSQAADTETKRGDALKNVLTSSMATREEPLTIVITTASDNLTGPFHQYDLPRYEQQLLGHSEWNDTEFPLLFEPDVDDPADSEETWMKCQPHYGVTVKPEFYESEWKRAQSSVSSRVDFMTKLLNVPFSAGNEIWIDSGIIRRAHKTWDPLDTQLEAFARVEMKGSADLSVNGDFTAVSFCAYIGDLKQIWCNTRYFIPDGVRVWQCQREEAVAKGWHVYKDYGNGIVGCDEIPYDATIHSDHENRFLYQRWVDDGYLNLVHGETIDYDDVARYVMDVILKNRGRVTGFGYDDYKSTDLVNRLAAMMGQTQGLQPYSQSFSAFTSPCQFFRTGLLTGHVYVDDNPINDYCVSNAQLVYDSQEVNCKPMKIDPRRRIDGLITMLMCIGQIESIGHKQKPNSFVK